MASSTTSGFRSLLALAAGAGMLAAASGARAQTATATATDTPAATATPAACNGTSKLRVLWSSRNPLVSRVFLSATQCVAPADCGTTPTGGTVTQEPITITLRDGQGHTVSATVTDPGVNAHGCPGGIDTYSGPSERTRFVYGRRTTVIAKLHVPQSAPTPPALSAPITVSVRDATGYEIDGTVNTCFATQFGVLVSLRCF
jgi:hypothetical protein